MPKLIEEYSAAVVKPQSLKEPDREDSDDDMGPESHSAESYISAVAPVFFGHCVLDRLQIRLLSVCNFRAPYSGVEAFGNISSPLCTLAIF